ncbi:MAG TPA: peptidylprolyl isomerase [Burkholderiales bacterium]|nr:peptidylprolyl isomerase [Burkholderiales bacterium]
MLETLRLPLLAAGLMLCTAALAADELAGKMGDVELRSSELKAIIDAQPVDAKRQLATDSAAMDRLVRSELMRKAVLNEARQKGWDKRPELQPLIERARDQVVVSSFVNSVAKPADGYPSEDEIKQFYEANKAQLLAPPQFQLAQIFLPAPDGDKAKSDDARKKITDLSAKLGKSGSDFAKLARENSLHKESAEKGGELGWISEEQMVPEIRKAVTAMNKGDVSQPIKTAAGWHIIKLLDKKPSATRPLPEIRSQLVVAMRNRKSQEMERSYLEALSIKLPPTINQIELGRLQGELR